MPALRAENKLTRIGVVWAGNPNHPDDLKRSMRARDLTPIFQVDGFECFSLQVGGARQQLQHKSVVMIDEWLDDFKETAAAINQLDLVISVDTAVAHLAGALGKPVWLLADFAGDWRWGLRTDETEWYPSMRIFRQEKPGDWAGVVAHVTSALTQLL